MEIREFTTLFDFSSDESFNKYKTEKSSDWKWTMEKDYPKKKNGIKVFSCFACGGGSTMGYKLAGCDVIGCCEIDPKMNEIYVKNHNPRFNYLMDIRDFNEIPDCDIPAELFNLDILDGSPPCTTFSVAGKREENWGKMKKFREGQKEQTLDDLSFVFIDTVRKLKPKTVIMENVEGLLLGNAWGYVQKIYKQFNKSGYFVHHWLLRGEKMGVPQTRHRVFFIAIRKDLNIQPDALNMSFDYVPIPYKEIQQASGERLNENTEIYKWLLKSEPADKRISDTVIRYGEKEKLFNHRICWPDRVMQTVSSAGEILRGVEKTRVSVEDIISAQTFPEDYYFPVRSFSAVEYLCGMSVPPVMIKRIVSRLIDSGVFDGRSFK